MSRVITPYKEDIANNRPGVDLFVWRVPVLFIFFVVSVLLFTLQVDTISVLKKAAILSCSLVLLLMIFYHLYLVMFIKNLRYDLSTDSLTIRSFLLNDEIKFSEIKELKRPSETLLLKKKKLFSYFRDAPQIVHPVAQLGRCTLERLGVVTFYSFVDTLNDHKNLLLIVTRDNRRYAISPGSVDEIVNLMNASRK